MYSTNFTLTKKKFCLSLHYNGANSYLFVNGIEIYKFKAKDSTIVTTPLCLGNILKDWSADNMKKAGLTGYDYDVSADYDAITVDDIKDIHKYLMKKNDILLMKIFGFVKKVFFIGLTILSDFTNVSSLSCIQMNNQPCKARPEIINVSSNDPLFYPFSFKTSKFSGNCNSINDPYAKIFVPDVVKDLNVKVFNLMSRINETKNIKWHETCKCECRFDVIVCNNEQSWNKNKCRCECKELIDKGVCHKGYGWNPSN